MQRLLSGDWDEVRLGDVATFHKGKGISKKDISDDGVECIRYGELYTKYSERIISIISKTNLSKDTLFLSQKNDILIPASGETAIDLATASCILKDNIGLGGDINVIRTNQDGTFLSYYLNTISKFNIASLAQGVSVIHLYSSQLKTLKIKLPLLKEQQKIAQILTTADKEIELLNNELEVLKEQKRGLMQRLLTGEVRV
jgi:type I restriction enzyme S subunit